MYGIIFLGFFLFFCCQRISLSSDDTSNNNNNNKSKQKLLDKNSNILYKYEYFLHLFYTTHSMAAKKEPTTAATTMASPSTRSRPARMVQNFHLVWLDGSIDEINNDDCRNSITKLRQVVNTVNTFIDVDECIEFINGIKEEKTFMISSGAFGPTIVPVVHGKPQVSTIYIFCGNKSRLE